MPTTNSTLGQTPVVSPTTNTAAGQPPIVAVQGKEARHALGPVEPGSKHRIVFTIDNPTDKPVKFRTVRGDCECISAVNPPEGIAAHGSVQVTVDYVAPKKPIDYESRVLIPTDDPARSLISLRVSSKAPAGQ